MKSHLVLLRPLIFVAETVWDDSILCVIASFSISSIPKPAVCIDGGGERKLWIRLALAST